MKHFVWISVAVLWLVYGANKAHQHYIVEMDPPSERAQLIIDSLHTLKGWKYVRFKDNSPKLYHKDINIEITGGIIVADVDAWSSKGQLYQPFAWTDRYWINQAFKEVLESYKELEKKNKTESIQQETDKIKELLKETK